jgi:hypothetical protein
MFKFEKISTFLSKIFFGLGVDGARGDKGDQGEKGECLR